MAENSNSTVENDKSLDTDRKQRRCFLCNKTFLVVVSCVALAVVVKYVVEKVKDKPLKIASSTTVDSQPDFENGVGVSYIERYRALEDQAILPLEENGWRLVLKAFGPCCLEQRAISERVAWDEIATNKTSKEWYENSWKPLCEKFDLDPTEKPTFYDRLPLFQYLVKNGITGTESETEFVADPEATDFTCYWENGEQKQGKGNYDDASREEREVLGPWKSEHPMVAQWIEENQDLFDLWAQAIRSPNYRAYHFVKDERFAFYNVLLPDVQFNREIARKFQMRARYRISRGDFDGAIDDVETLLILSRCMLAKEDPFFVVMMVGNAVMGMAAGIGLDENPQMSPSIEQRERMARLWREQSEFYDARELAKLAFAYEGEYFNMSMFQDVLALRREEGVPFLSVVWPKWQERFNFDESDLDSADTNEFFDTCYDAYCNLRKSSVLFRGGFDDALAMREMKSIVEQIADNPKHIKDLESELSAGARSEERDLARVAFRMFSAPVDPVQEAMLRCECTINLRRVADALKTYEAENGTLPPAFSVDSEGKPLHSWRVLILPYLGDEEKALYEKIRLDEPWNSEANKAVLAEAPAVYRCPSNPNCGSEQTGYTVLLGEDSLFDNSGKGKSLTELSARPDVDVLQQYLVVERYEPIHWAQPDAELDVQAFRDTFTGVEPVGVGSYHTDGMDVCTADGSAHYVSQLDPSYKLETGLTGKIVVEEDETTENPIEVNAESQE